jgi:hypothetical protein
MQHYSNQLTWDSDTHSSWVAKAQPPNTHRGKGWDAIEFVCATYSCLTANMMPCRSWTYEFYNIRLGWSLKPAHQNKLLLRWSTENASFKKWNCIVTCRTSAKFIAHVRFSKCPVVVEDMVFESLFNQNSPVTNCAACWWEAASLRPPTSVYWLWSLKPAYYMWASYGPNGLLGGTSQSESGW